jgi:hypothetical protein
VNALDTTLGLSGARAVVFGGREAVVVRMALSAEGHIEDILVEAALPIRKDWIWEAHWLYSGDAKEGDWRQDFVVAVARAHNYAELWGFGAPEGTVCIVSAWSSVRCLLYSARFFGEHASTLTMASGTIFQEVLLWHPFEQDAAVPAKRARLEATHLDNIPTRRTLAGHAGVIFHIAFSDDGACVRACVCVCV